MMHRNIRRGVLLGVALALALSAATPAQGHYRFNAHRWWFRGYTVTQPSGKNKIDPINIFYYRGGRITLDRITKHIADHAGLIQADRCTAHIFGACVKHADCPGSVQFLTFVHYSADRRAGAPANHVDEVDRRRETSCKSGRYHTRIWDDKEHDESTIHHRIKTWAPANVHRDTKIDGEDHVEEPFDTDEHWLVRKMRKHCVIPKWRVLPGSHSRSGIKKGKKRFSDGYVSLISMAHKSSPGRCPG